MIENQLETETFAATEITAAINSLQADMNRLLAIVTFGRVFTSRDVRGMRKSFAGPWGTFSSAIGPYDGSLNDWQDGIGALASGHALPVLAISAALAGPLLYLVGQERGWN